MIETKRLRIIPLDSEQFALLLNGVHFMEDALRLTPSNETLDPHTRQAMTGQYQLAGKHPENFLLLTNWQIILKSENKAIGSACFKSLPDAEGSVEVGYGIYASYRNHGYMTEALKALCKWAFDIAGVQSVIAETEKEMQAIREAGNKKNLQDLDALIHHLRSSWEILRADQPLRELYKLLHSEGTPEDKTIGNAVKAVLDKGSEIIRLAKVERRKYNNG